MPKLFDQAMQQIYGLPKLGADVSTGLTYNLSSLTVDENNELTQFDRSCPTGTNNDWCTETEREQLRRGKSEVQSAPQLVSHATGIFLQKTKAHLR